MSEHIKIQGVIPHIQYVSNGILTSYDFPFAIFQTDNMEVYFNDILQAKNTYQVTFTATEPGGTVTFNTPPAVNTKITLVRNLSIERTSDFQEGGALRANTLNDELDYIIACQQQLADKLNRTMTLPVYAADGDVDFTMPNPDAGKAIVWNANGKKLEASTVAVNDMESTLRGYKTAAESAAATATNKADVATDKAQIATQKAQEAIDTVNNKANKDLDNITALAQNNITKLCMPSTEYIDIPLALSDSTYVAPATGFINVHAKGTSNANVGFLIENVDTGVTVGAACVNNYATSYPLLPIQKNQTVRLWKQNGVNIAKARFYYAEGEI